MPSPDCGLMQLAGPLGAGRFPTDASRGFIPGMFGSVITGLLRFKDLNRRL